MNQTLGPIKNMMNQLKAVQNPQALLQNMLNQNPNIQQAIQYVNQNGGDPKAAFYKLAQEQGIDPESLMKQIF